MKTSGLGKTLTAFANKNSEAISEIFKEYEGDGYSYWIYLNDGWYTTDGIQTIHEWTVKELIEAFKGVSK